MMQKIEKRGTCLELLLVEEYVPANSPHDLTINKNGTWPTGLNMLLIFLNESKKFTLQFPQRTTMIHLKMVRQRKDMEWVLQQINSWV
jgi:hypothetical protein